MKIRLERIDIQEEITVEVLLDSSVTGLVMSSEFARKQGFQLKKIKRPLYIRNVNRSFNKEEPIEHMVNIVATTSIQPMITHFSKALIGYLVVGITRELNKELSLYCYPIYTTILWSMLQQCPTVPPILKAICLPHVYSTVTVQDCVSCPNIHVSYI